MRPGDHGAFDASDRPELGRRPGAQREVQHRQVFDDHRAQVELVLPDVPSEAVHQQTLRRFGF